MTIKKLDFKKSINFLIEFFYLGIIFLVPIYFGAFFASANPFEFQKVVLFKILFIFLFFFSALKFILYPGFLNFFKVAFKKYFLVVFLILIFSFLSVFWSIDPRLAFWGSLTRQMGWVSYLYFFLFFIILSLNLLLSENKKKSVNNLIITALISSVFVSLYAILQFWGYDFLIWAEPASITKRAMSTLGQPNFLGSFLLFSLPLAVYLFIKNKKIVGKVLFLLLFLIQLLALVFSGSRGAWLGFLGASLLLLVLCYYKKNKKIFFSGLAVITLVVVFLFLGKNSVSLRFKSAFDISQGSSSVRTFIWSHSFDSFENRLFGYGLENQKEALWPYYQSDLAINNKVNVVFDRAHNLVLDILLTVGIVGLFLWLCFYYSIFKLIFRNIKNNNNGLLFWILCWSISAYLISLLFNFSIIVTEIYFWAFVSILISLDNSLEIKDLKWLENKKDGLFRKVLILILFILCSLGVWWEIKNIKADYYFYSFKEYFYQEEIPSATLIFSYLRQENVPFNEYYYQFIDMVYDNFTKFKDASSRRLALDELNEVFVILDQDTKNKSFEYDMARAQFLALSGNFVEAEKVFNILELRSPQYPNIYYKKAKMEILKSDFILAKKYLEKTLSLLPDDSEVESEINLKALKSYKKMINNDLNSINNIIK